MLKVAPGHVGAQWTAARVTAAGVGASYRWHEYCQRERTAPFADRQEAPQEQHQLVGTPPLQSLVWARQLSVCHATDKNRSSFLCVLSLSLTNHSFNGRILGLQRSSTKSNRLWPPCGAAAKTARRAAPAGATRHQLWSRHHPRGPRAPSPTSRRPRRASERNDRRQGRTWPSAGAADGRDGAFTASSWPLLAAVGGRALVRENRVSAKQQNTKQTRPLRAPGRRRGRSVRGITAVHLCGPRRPRRASCSTLFQDEPPKSRHEGFVEARVPLWGHPDLSHASRRPTAQHQKVGPVLFGAFDSESITSPGLLV